MTLLSAAALFGSMVILALTPDASAAAVAARSTSAGSRHGLVSVAGIVAGDLVFIAVVFSGLSFFADASGSLFTWLKVPGSAYLVWMGFAAMTAKPSTAAVPAGVGAWTSSFLAGFLMTLGDPKAILFYLSFLPAYVDLNAATPADAAAVCCIAAVSVGSVKGGYAVLAGKAIGLLHNARMARRLNFAAGLVMIGTGVVLWI
jgi:threonine/homoserine/homoserine lactone efflux protein